MRSTLPGTGVDERVVEAVWEVIEAMHPALKYRLHAPIHGAAEEWKTSIVNASDFTLDMLHQHGFITGVSWNDPVCHKRYFLLEVVPEGIAITHTYDWIGTTVLGLSGMPRGVNVTFPKKVAYVTVAPEGFASAILAYLKK